MNSCCGFTLVEVMIALVVLSIGLLGLAGLQTVALRQNNSAQVSSQAVDLVNELADRMRANRIGVDANDYAGTPAVPGFDCITDFSGTVSGTECTPQEIALLDLSTWQTSVSRIFPGGAGTIACVDIDPADGIACTPGSMFTVTIAWQEQNDPFNPGNLAYSVTVQP